ncbi:MAG: flagellar basal body P-ring formation chaperone FlgA [Desulfotignum sp.]|nr:flagellar basal body P-ring formation chaperone FlgA [Desulfotignum sp.]MCF8088888.1 flagellar basal body P-ring formation chaperone FlgA [Desulfotignum sp.]MCF8136077.1 flagellar basal body P-ring formation chaperone FlgA [Desulfotignum sp.]
MIRKTGCIGLLALCFWVGMAVPVAFNRTLASDTGLPGGKPDQTISLEMFQEAFELFVSQQPVLVSSDVVISRFNVARNNPVPAGEVEIQLLRTNNRPFSRYVRVKAVISVDGIPANNAEVSAWLDVFETVVCAARDLPQGHILTKRDLVEERKNISREMDEAVIDTGQLVGLMAKRSIRKGDMVKHSMVEKKPVIKRGDQVTILVESGLLRVTIPGTALDDGFAGETVSVENSMSSKKIFARVIDEVTVRVDI